MKKTIFALIAALTVNVGTGFAAPINNLTQDHTALGIGSDGFYLEHKIADNFTLGYQTVDYASDSKDLYGQINFSNNLRGIIGSRDFDSAGSKMYFGLAVNGPVSSEANGYASLISGNKFKELQVGASIKLSYNTDLNLSYHSFMPDFGHDKSGLGVGATFKF